MNDVDGTDVQQLREELAEKTEENERLRRHVRQVREALAERCETIKALRVEMREERLAHVAKDHEAHDAHIRETELAVQLDGALLCIAALDTELLRVGRILSAHGLSSEGDSK